MEADTLPTVLQCFNACPTYGKGEHRLQVCFFSATLHSDAIKNLTASICQNPTWVDLKGKDAIPDSVHHVVYRVKLPSNNKGQKQDDQKQEIVGEKRQREAVTDGVHVGKVASMSPREQKSQQLKEMKQHILLKIVDQFQVRFYQIFIHAHAHANHLEIRYLKILSLLTYLHISILIFILTIMTLCCTHSFMCPDVPMHHFLSH